MPDNSEGADLNIAIQTSLKHFEISNASSNYTSQCASRKPALVSKSTVRVARLSPGAGEHVICIDARWTHSACVSGRRVHQVHRKSYYMSHLPSRCNAVYQSMGEWHPRDATNETLKNWHEEGVKQHR